MRLKRLTPEQNEAAARCADAGIKTLMRISGIILSVLIVLSAILFVTGWIARQFGG